APSAPPTAFAWWGDGAARPRHAAAPRPTRTRAPHAAGRAALPALPQAGESGRAGQPLPGGRPLLLVRVRGRAGLTSILPHADMTLNPKQRSQLRSLAHHLKPILQIGKDGVTAAALDAVSQAFNTRELLKVKVQEA